MLKGKLLIAQGGGPTAVINQSLVGAVLEARKIPSVERVYGSVHGVRGILREDFLDLTRETSNNLEAVANTPAAALGSTRDKPDAKYCEEILAGSARPRNRNLLLHGRQQLVGHLAHFARQGEGRELSAAVRPYPQDDRQRPDGQRPHAGIPVGGPLRRAGVRGRKSRQPRAAGRLCGRCHGPPRRLPDRRRCACPQISRRRPAPRSMCRSAPSTSKSSLRK